ncbi:MAG: hypothetical protein QM635_08310 [Microbacteriaceae bacterium]
MDDGFGLIEAVVAMLLFALVAISFLPLLANSLGATTSNVTLEAASGIVSEEFADVRLVTDAATEVTCTTVEGLVTVGTASAGTDSRGVALYKTVALTCPDDNDMAALTVSVGTSSTGASALVEATTLIRLTGTS